MNTCKNCGYDKDAPAYRGAILTIDTTLDKPIVVPWYSKLAKIKLPRIKMRLPNNKIVSVVKSSASVFVGMVAIVSVLGVVFEVPYWLGYYIASFIKPSSIHNAVGLSEKLDQWMGLWFVGLISIAGVLMLLPLIKFLKGFGDGVIVWVVGLIKLLKSLGDGIIAWMIKRK